jgi:dipeptide/tripeptide permease
MQLLEVNQKWMILCLCNVNKIDKIENPVFFLLNILSNSKYFVLQNCAEDKKCRLQTAFDIQFQFSSFWVQMGCHKSFQLPFTLHLSKVQKRPRNFNS